MDISLGMLAGVHFEITVFNTLILLIISYPLLLSVNIRMIEGASRYIIIFESCLLGFLIWFGPMLGWMSCSSVHSHPGLEYGIFIIGFAVGLFYGQAILYLHDEEAFTICASSADRWPSLIGGIVVLFFAYYISHLPLILFSMIFASPID